MAEAIPLAARLAAKLGTVEKAGDGVRHRRGVVPGLPGEDCPVLSDKVGGVGCRAVSAPDGVIHSVNQQEDVHVLVFSGLAGQGDPFLVSVRLPHRVAFSVPAVASRPLITGVGAGVARGVGFDDVNDDYVHIITIAIVEVLGGGTRPPEGRSGKRTEDHYHRLLRQQSRKADRDAVYVLQGEVYGCLTDPDALAQTAARVLVRLAIGRQLPC